MKKLFIITFLFIACQAFPQRLSGIKLTQTLCREMALKNSEDMQKQTNVLHQAMLDKDIARASYFPDIDATVMDVFTKDNKLSETSKLQMKGTYMAGISLSLPIYAGGRITTGNKLADIGVEVQKIQSEKTRRDIIYNADKAFYTFLATRSKVDVIKSYIIQMDSLMAMTKRSVDVEMATNSDLLRIDSKRSQMEYNLNKAMNGVELCRMSLCAVLGVDINTPIEIDDSELKSLTSLEDDCITGGTAGNITERPEYQLLLQNIKVKELEIKQARASYLPTFALSAQYSKYGWAYIKGNVDGYSYKSEIKGDMPVLMATLSIPLWHWGKEIKGVKKAKLSLENAKLDLKKNERLLNIQNHQVKQNVEDSYRMISTAVKAFVQAEDNLHNMQLRYDNSMATLTDLLDAHSQKTEAMSNVIEARTQYMIYRSEYEKLVEGF